MAGWWLGAGDILAPVLGIIVSVTLMLVCAVKSSKAGRRHTGPPFCYGGLLVIIVSATLVLDIDAIRSNGAGT